MKFDPQKKQLQNLPLRYKVTDTYKKFFMFVSIIYLGGATTLTRYTMGNIAMNAGFFISLFLSIILVVKNRKFSFNFRGIILLFCVLVVWTVLQCLKYKGLQIPYSIIYDFILGAVICNVYRESIFPYFEYCMTRLSIIALVLWILSFCLPFFPSLLVSLTPSNWICGLTESNIIVFGLHDPGLGEPASFFRRNCGFAWEPGRFATLLIWALLINLAQNKFRINKNLVILLMTIITTQSTTGYISAMFMGIMFLYNIRRKYFIVVASFFSVLFIVILSLPFMWEKIEDLWISEDHNIEFVEKVGYLSENLDEGYIPQRFDALLWESYNVINDPLLGYGKDILNSFVGQTFQGKLTLYNGTIKVLSIFGIFIGLLYYICVYYGSCYFSKIMRIKGSVWLLLVFIMINCSYYFILEPLFLSMCFLPLFVKTMSFQKMKKCKRNNHKIRISSI